MKIFIFIILISISSFIQNSFSRTVEVGISAPWNESPYSFVTEVGEALQSISSYDLYEDLYWKYIDNICYDRENNNIDYLLKNKITGINEGSSDLFMLANQKVLNSLNKALEGVPTSLKKIIESSIKTGAYRPAGIFYEKTSNDFFSNNDITCEDSFIFVDSNTGNYYCTFQDALSSVQKSELKDNDDWEKYIPGGDEKFGKISFYGSPGESKFCSTYLDLRKIYKSQNISLPLLSLRPYYPNYNSTFSHLLQGYGVFLDIKNMEYKNVDEEKSSESISSEKNTKHFKKDEEYFGINFYKLQENYPQLTEELKVLYEELKNEEESLSSSTNIQEMKVWKLRELSLQTSQLVHSTSSRGSTKDGLAYLKEIVQSFPSHASFVSSAKVSSSISKLAIDIYNSNLFDKISNNGLYINGKFIDLSSSTFNFYDVLYFLEKENLMHAPLLNFSLSPSLKRSVLSLSNKQNNFSTSEEPNFENIIRVDFSKNSKGMIHFFNNLEKDFQYSRWSKSVKQILVPSWSIQPIAKNLYTMISIIDPFTMGGCNLFMQMRMMYEQQYPIRFGIVFASNTNNDLLASFIKIFTLIEKQNKETAWDFLGSISELVMNDYTEGTSSLSLDMLSKMAEYFSSNSKKEILSIIKSEEYEKFPKINSKYISNLNVPINSYSINGVVSTESLNESLMQLLGREQYILSSYVSSGLITDKTKAIFSEIMKISNAKPRFHRLLSEDNPIYTKYFSSNKFNEWFDSISFVVGSNINETSQGNVLNVHVPVSLKGITTINNILNWTLENQNNLILLISFDYNSINQNVFDENCSSEKKICTSFTNSDVFDLVSYFFSSFFKEQVIINSPVSSITKSIYYINNGNENFKKLNDNINSILIGDFPQFSRDDNLEFINSYKKFSKSSTNLYNIEPDNILINYNGRSYIIPPTDSFYLDDINTLIDVQYKDLGKSLTDFFSNYSSYFKKRMSNSNINFPISQAFHFLSIGSYIFSMRSNSMRFDIDTILDDFSNKYKLDLSSLLYQVEPSEMSDNSLISIYFIFDPLTLAGQRASSLIEFFRDELNLSFTVLLTPNPDLTQFPLKNYYRFIFSTTSSHFESIRQSYNSHATFSNLPRQHTLTTRLDVPELWNVQTLAAEQDSDNLRCTKTLCKDSQTFSSKYSFSKFDSDSYSELTTVRFYLKTLLVPGQCFEQKNNNYIPPNGLQLGLYNYSYNNSNQSLISDTLVMRNLGYFQLQAPQPGLYSLSLTPGRGKDIYDIFGSTRVSQKTIAVKSFGDTINRLIVKKKEGMEEAILLSDSELPIVKSDNNKDNTSISTTDDDTIHVFSLATGHLYERLLRIMMLSVVKQSSKPVKFWLLENYLSPSFKSSVESMSKEYNFQVQFVTYKWPQWLTQQSEQQRIIWGYKILFLDVLFPLNIKKVIYIDSDQVVKSDIAELWNLDLQGHPYAYTPFCTSREETLGFQFWRQGYWHNHLQGKPYHISALYVVDLEVFRKQAVGDTLRAIYDQLSKDPNSLSNLDQDLPNFAQHQVPIFSLPQEWLWCETWCSDDSKKEAKTIDLCNNPLHKESKLDMAKRVISGDLFPYTWTDLDEEIDRFLKSQKN